MRLIDADEIPWKSYPNDYGESYDDYVEKSNIDKMSTVDAVPIVRCKDCKHRVYKYMNEEIGEIGGCELFNRVMSNDDFCSYGKRKENEDER